MKTIGFIMLVNQFTTEYLVTVRDLNPSTVLSYRDSVALPITFISDIRGKRPEALEIADIIAECVEEFLGWLESERTNSPSTRDIRFVVVHSLLRYPCSQRPEYTFHSQQILSIPVKKTAQTEVAYLDTAQTGKLLAAPDVTTVRGKRDLTLLCLLYGSGYRVQELADVRMSDIRFTVPPPGSAYR